MVSLDRAMGVNSNHMQRFSRNFECNVAAWSHHSHVPNCNCNCNPSVDCNVQYSNVIIACMGL